MATSAAMWSMVSIVLLLAGIAAMLWLQGADKHEEEAKVPAADPLLGAKATPSMKATRKYFFAVIGLMLLQIGMGAITAHYAVEGQAFFGIPLAQVLAVRRQPDRAHPDRHLLDCHRMAGHWPLRRTAALRAANPSCRSSASTRCSGRSSSSCSARPSPAGSARCSTAAWTSASGWATRASSSRAWAASGRSCCSSACCSGSSCSAARCGRR